MVYNYFSGPCGSGKTRAVSTTTVSNMRAYRNTMIVSPTTKLLKQTAKNVGTMLIQANLPIEPKLVYSDEGRDTVYEQHVEALEAAKSSPLPTTILNTHQGFKGIPGKLRRGWGVFYDEEFPVYQTFTLEVPLLHSVITQHINKKPLAHCDGIQRLNPKSKSIDQLKAILAMRKTDEIAAVVAPLAEVLLDGNVDVMVETQHWHSLKSGQLPASTRFHVVATDKVLRGYEQVTFMGAFYERTLHYKLWRALGIPMQRETGMPLDYTYHANGDRVELFWAFDEHYGARAKAHVDRHSGVSRIDAYVAAVKQFFGSEPFAWMANADDGANWPFDQAARVDNKPHGINDEYLGYDHIALFGSYNFESECYGFFDKVGISGEEIDFAMNFLPMYQGALRTAFRKLTFDRIARIVVPTRKHAEMFAEIMPGASIGPLPGLNFDARKRGGQKKDPGEKKTDEERKATKAARDAARRLENLSAKGKAAA